MADNWREQVGAPAKFRDVVFRVEKSGLAGGRKTVAHEYPGRDVAFVEDLGRRVRRFSLVAYVVGDDYLQQRDALTDALEQDGPGPLVHPYHGNRRVAVLTFGVDESLSEGGIARFTIEFAETESTAFSPSISTAPAARVSVASDHALATLQNRFTSAYKLTIPTGQTAPAFTFDSLTTLVSDYTKHLQDSLSPVVRGTQDLASLKSKTDAILNSVGTLLRTPSTLALKFADVLKSFRNMPLTPSLGFAALVAAYNFSTTASRPIASTPSRTVEQSNYDAIVSLLGPTTIVEAAGHATAAAAAAGRSQTPTTTAGATEVVDLGGFDSYDEAVAARDVLFAAIDTEAAAVNDDDVYASLIQLRAELAIAVPGDDNHLARLIAYTPPVTQPSLVIAYGLYGDLALTDDIVRRNHVRHPGFVIGGRELQVLSHA